MNDKLFNLVEKMYIEFSGNFKQIDQRFNAMDQRFSAMDQRIGDVEKGQKKLELLIENEVLDKIRTLYDDRAEMKESLTSINLKLDSLFNVTEDHELRIRVLEAGKKAI